MKVIAITDLPHYGLSQATMQRILDNISNEVYVTDADRNILYISDISQEHYGLSPQEMIGHNHADFDGIYWYPSSLPRVYAEKRKICIEHMTIKGQRIVTIANPVMDEAGNLKTMVAMVQGTHLNYDMDIASADDTHCLIQRSHHNAIGDIITVSAKMQKLLDFVSRSSKSDIPILIQGESGTGKTMLAQYIHEHSNRKNAPFLSINCAAIPENLLESELFGYAPYAFTGASSKGKDGLLKSANNGTLFLDEIGELALPLQSKILNVVEHHKFFPVGSSNEENVNVRIISATNRDLGALVSQKQFREDLFWRLNVVDVHIPSLLERQEDIIPLANFYLNYFNDSYQTDRTFSPQALNVFENYSWPGNVRQLRNIIERAFVVSSSPVITPRDFPAVLVKDSAHSVKDDLQDFNSQMDAMEKTYIRRFYQQCKSSRKLAATIHVSQSKANRLINKYCSDIL